jgi:hypothetical protein
MINNQTVVRLIEGIRSIVSESRSSLSVGDVKLLNECIAFLETVRDMDNPSNPASLEIVASVVKILLHVLLSHDLDKVKELLF